jgi:SAM-dependent methyltransferase
VAGAPYIHDVAARGYREAERYDRSRPAYPGEALEALARALSIGPASTVIEIGAGTGKMTRLLLPRARRVVAVEPVAEMRRQLRALLPAARVVGGQAEALPLAAGSADAVVVAQAFHWFDGPPALREIHRVLRAGGGLGLLWNVRDERVPWVRRLSDIMEPHSGGAPRYRSGAWRRAFEKADLFTPLEEARFEHRQVGPSDTVVERVASVSFIAALPQPDRSRVLEEVERLLAEDPATAGRSEVVLPYRTDVAWCAKR